MANCRVTILGAVLDPTGHGCEQLAAAEPAVSRAVRQGGPHWLLQDFLPFYFKAVSPPVTSTQNTGLCVENSATGIHLIKQWNSNSLSIVPSPSVLQKTPNILKWSVFTLTTPMLEHFTGSRWHKRDSFGRAPGFVPGVGTFLRSAPAETQL